MHKYFFLSVIVAFYKTGYMKKHEALSLRCHTLEIYIPDLTHTSKIALQIFIRITGNGVMFPHLRNIHVHAVHVRLARSKMYQSAWHTHASLAGIKLDSCGESCMDTLKARIFYLLQTFSVLYDLINSPPSISGMRFAVWKSHNQLLFITKSHLHARLDPIGIQFNAIN